MFFSVENYNMEDWEYKDITLQQALDMKMPIFQIEAPAAYTDKYDASYVFIDSWYNVEHCFGDPCI